MSDAELWAWGDRRPAMEAAREIVTLFKMSEEQGCDDESHRGATVREITKGWLPWQRDHLIEVLAAGVAGSFDSLDEWSAHVVAAMADDAHPGGDQ